MAQEKKIHVTILNTELDLLTSDPEEKKELSDELNDYLSSLVNKYPGGNQTLILTYACLKIYEERKQFENEVSKLTAERDRLNRIVQSALYNINLE